GVVPPVFKWIRNEDTSGANVSISIPGSIGNNLSDGPNAGDEDSTIITKRHMQKESANNVVLITETTMVANEKIASPYQSKKNLGPTTLLSIARTSKKLQSFSNFTEHCLNTPTISSFK
ncbi:10089_t:CDS:2, partial [Racocetra persica]